jgi:glucosylceramidase
MPNARWRPSCRAAALLVPLCLLIAASAASAASRSRHRAAPARVEVVQTNASLSQRLSRLHNVRFSTSRPRGVPIIAVDDRAHYQRFDGLGGGMTDSSAWLINDELAPATRATLMTDLFGSSGIHLNLIRVPIGASDFTVDGRPYSYDDQPPGQSDPSLSGFSIAHDEAYIIPALRQALLVNPQAMLLASPWSPPAWMKTNQAFDDHDMQATLLPSAYSPLAQYFVRFLRTYAGQGVPIAAITPQNEPWSGVAYPGMDLSEPAEASFIAQYLRPALSGAGLRTQIYGDDSGWDSLSYPAALASGLAARALAGIAWHCYFGSPSVMSRLHRVAPALDQIVSECSPPISPLSTAELLISSLRNWASAVAVWNLALDPQGGPVQAPNSGCAGCTGVVTISEQTHTVALSLTYYRLGQVSAFVKPGARRIGSANFVTYYLTRANTSVVSPGLDDVAFLNPDGSKVLIAYDNSAARMRFGVEWRGRSFTYTIAPQAMTTFIWR